VARRTLGHPHKKLAMKQAKQILRPRKIGATSG